MVGWRAAVGGSRPVAPVCLIKEYSDQQTDRHAEKIKIRASPCSVDGEERDSVSCGNRFFHHAARAHFKNFTLEIKTFSDAILNLG